MRFLQRIFTTTIAILIIVALMPGIRLDGNAGPLDDGGINKIFTSVILALVLSLLNVFIKPLLIFLTLPITLITLGLFLLVINAAIILMASSLVDGFIVDGFWWALLFSIVLSLIVSFVDRMFAKKEKEN